MRRRQSYDSPQPTPHPPRTSPTIRPNRPARSTDYRTSKFRAASGAQSVRGVRLRAAQWGQKPWEPLANFDRHMWMFFATFALFSHRDSFCGGVNFDRRPVRFSAPSVFRVLSNQAHVADMVVAAGSCLNAYDLLGKIETIIKTTDHLSLPNHLRSSCYNTHCGCPCSSTG